MVPKHLRAVGLGLALAANLSVTASASMSGVEWLTRMEQIQRSRGDPARHVHSDGKLQDVDLGSVAVTILHPELRSPDNSIWMPAMRMVFHVTDAGKLKGLRPGDNVHFVVGRHRGAVVITEIRKTR